MTAPTSPGEPVTPGEGSARDGWVVVVCVIAALALVASVIGIGFGMRAIDESKKGASTLAATSADRAAPAMVDVALGEFTDNTRPFVREHNLTLWQSAELAKALRGIPLNA